MKGQLLYKVLFFLMLSCFVTSTFAQDEPPTLPSDPENITDYLPLTLVSFSAALNSGTAQLYWKTSNEVNVSNFLVERSTDGQAFKGIGNVLAKNATTNSYEFADNGTIHDVAYYRLKMIDKDGTFQYSATVLIKNTTISKLSIYPNPARNLVTVTHGIPVGKASLSIVNIAGNRLQTTSVNSGSQQTSITINSSIISGTYLLQYVDEKGIKTLQFMKL